jgi:small-conductance mechanosensitive channel
MWHDVAFLDQVLLGNKMRAWLISFIVLVAVMFGIWVLRLVATRRLARLARRTKTELDDLAVDLLGRTRFFLMLLVSVYAASYALELPEARVRLIRSFAVFSFLLQCAFWGNRLITYGLTHYLKKRGQDDAASLTTVTTLSYLARGLLWIMLLLLALDNLGIKITGLITGLGIGGVAVALAAQEVLKDLFASLAIVLDKPFLIGDSIMVDAFQGKVEHIGIKTTRLRSLTGEELVFSNSDILSSRIRNFKRMEERWTVTTLSVTYDTPAEKLAALPTLVAHIIESQPGARMDRAHLRSFGESALVYEIAYTVEDPNYRSFMNVQHTINLAILRRFEEEGIKFAFPIRTVRLEGGEGAEGRTGGALRAKDLHTAERAG